ncbi:MAG: amidohydrolase [Clostridia bacterium]|nr:amidohydrolase [Clostridia bacterium]
MQSYKAMIIDFHTHIFPDKIAEKTISFLSKKGNILPNTDGTAGGLVSSMKNGEIDISVALPVVTSPHQFDSINRFAAEVNREYDGIISFAGIRPLCDDIEGKMDFIKESGFKGVKIHPDYQGEYITHEGYIKILECARANDLIVVTHAGVDCGFVGEAVKCPPELALKVISRVKHPKLVLAHLGGCEMSDEVIKHLLDTDVYFDTSFVLKSIPKNDLLTIINGHGVDKILFASDSPWSDVAGDARIIKSLGLTQEDEEKILYKNAKALLSI